MCGWAPVSVYYLTRGSSSQIISTHSSRIILGGQKMNWVPILWDLENITPAKLHPPVYQATKLCTAKFIIVTKWWIMMHSALFWIDSSFLDRNSGMSTGHTSTPYSKIGRIVKLYILKIESLVTATLLRILNEQRRLEAFLDPPKLRSSLIIMPRNL